MRAVEGSVPTPTSPLLYLPLPCPQATVLCDLLLLHILPKRHYYKQKKFKYAEQMGPGAVRELLEFTAFRGLGPTCLCWGASCSPGADFFSLPMLTQGEHDPAATSSTLGLQENMKTS